VTDAQASLLALHFIDDYSTLHHQDDGRSSEFPSYAKPGTSAAIDDSSILKQAG